MFDRLFNRKKAENKPSEVGDTPTDTIEKYLTETQRVCVHFYS